MSNGSLGEGIRSIAELLRDCDSFYVAEYQRGYKWTRSEVRQLLDDVEGFKREEHGTFYCLQPLVVAPREDRHWELIDGQQRMTTIFLILNYLDEIHYRMEYRTRSGTVAFLDAIGTIGITAESDWQRYSNEHLDHDNIDNYHLFEVYKAIFGWFGEHPALDRHHFATKLRDQTGVIWYEVHGGMSREKLFLNLNSGKISLTNAELIKALFLKSNAHVHNPEAFRLKQKEIAEEWDAIEYALQDDAFWFFINSDAQRKDQATRIDFVFDLLTEKKANCDEPLYSYLSYARRGFIHVEFEWEQVKDCFQVFQEWFEETPLYHDIGFLITTGLAKTATLYKEIGETKSAFRTWVTGLIREAFSSYDLESLKYGENNKDIAKVLLLFNIESLKQGGREARFPFNYFRQEKKWSLEHIHAQNSQALGNDEEWEAYVKDVLPKIELEQNDPDSQLINDLRRSLDPGAAVEKKQERREELERKVFTFLGPELKDEDVHNIGNLALLSGSHNSSLNNGYFYVKRRQIIEWDKQGCFIPISTKNVFLKYYCKDVSQMNRWTVNDQTNYLREIRLMISNYLPPEKGGVMI